MGCATFGLADNGELAATKANAQRFHVLMLDDVGTKVPLDKVETVKPTYVVETSPGNFQYGYALSEPLADQSAVEGLQSAFVDAGLCDKGAKGIGRWARLPFAINGKAKYRSDDGDPFECRLTSWSPEQRFTIEALFAAFGLKPASPPLPKTGGAKRPRVSVGPVNISHEVLTPRSPENPVVAKLQTEGMYKRNLGDGRHEITCPWIDQHTDRVDSGTVYFEPSDAFPTGGFRCQHAHGDELGISNLLSRLEIDAEQARHRHEILMVRGAFDQVVRAAEFVLADSGAVYQMGGAIVFLRSDPITRDVSIELANEATLTRELTRHASWKTFDKRSKAWDRADPTPRIVTAVLKALDYEFLPPLTGIARQPYYRPSDGALVTVPGYDRASGVFGTFEPVALRLDNVTEADAKIALSRLQGLLSEFRFETPNDEAAALAAMMTATVRPSLPLAPAFLTTAPDSGVGKSYLNRIITAFAGGEPARASFPKTSDEATKAVTSLLIAKPSTIEWDDMDTSFRPHGTINAMLTSESMTNRILGVSRTVTVGTRVFVIASGINVEPERDMLRRVITIRLAARDEEGIGRRFAGRPADEVRERRAEMIASVLTIIEAWKQAGRPTSDVPTLATYGDDWADHARHPLIWLGLPDPAQCLFDQVEQDTHGAALSIFLAEWHKEFGDQPVTIRKVLGKIDDLIDTPLSEALLDLPIYEGRHVNRSKFGWYLGRNVKRIFGGYRIVGATADGRKGWIVEKVVKGAPASPPI